MRWKVGFYEDADGKAPVEEFLDSLAAKQRNKLVALIEKLAEYGVDLPFPYSSQVRGKLRELRTRLGKTRLRILYFADSKRTFILLHGVVKNTGKLEEAHIQIAEERLADHNRRLKT
ncbi:MAG: type II toxin-antitoxin system RelE/ParE family toxin [Terriglobia bacterium]